MKLNIQENYIIYGKVICTHCGSDYFYHELMHVRTPFDTDTIICKTCFKKEIPSGREIQALVNKDVSENFTIEELKDFPNFEAFWEIIDAQNWYEDDWKELRLEYKGFYLTAYYELTEKE